MATCSPRVGLAGKYVDGQVIEPDGKTENAQHVLALDPFMVAVLQAQCVRS